MSFDKKNGGIQLMQSKFKKFDLADVVLKGSTVFLNILDLPPDAIVTKGYLCITEAFNSTSTDTLKVGDGTTNDRYLTATSIHTTGITALVPTGAQCTTTTLQKLGILWTSGGGTPTTGQGWLFVEFHVPGVEDSFYVLP